jgi:hypothetical protein
MNQRVAQGAIRRGGSVAALPQQETKMEYREETIIRLRKRLGREPTNEEVAAEREMLIKRAYADMAATAIMLQDEARKDQDS